MQGKLLQASGGRVALAVPVPEFFARFPFKHGDAAFENVSSCLRPVESCCIANGCPSDTTPKASSEIHLKGA